jgi:hypothetical protein
MSAITWAIFTAGVMIADACSNGRPNYNDIKACYGVMAIVGIIGMLVCLAMGAAK